jgi:integrase
MSKLKNVTIIPVIYHGEYSWKLFHCGIEDVFYTFFATLMLEKYKFSKKTRELYCFAIAEFIDYLVESENWALKNGIEFIDGLFLLEIITSYTKAISGADKTNYAMVKEISTILGLKPLKPTSQRVKIAAINFYLQVSEDFNIRMKELTDIADIGGVNYSESSLFPNLTRRQGETKSVKIAMTKNSVIAGVICGGVRLKRLARLKPESSCGGDEDEGFSFESAFPIESAPDLINKGFKSYRDRAFFCLLAACGCRISEALLITLKDINFEKQLIYLKNPHNRNINDYYGYLTIEEVKNLPWKGRTTIHTLLIEPFGTEFWSLLEKYIKTEYIMTNHHPFIWQKKNGEPLFKTNDNNRNIRRSMYNACKKINIRKKSPHSMRHLYGTYCLNYFPRINGIYGLPLSTVQTLMGHAKMTSTMKYAIPDIELLRTEQMVSMKILSGFRVKSRQETVIEILEKKLLLLQSELAQEA